MPRLEELIRAEAVQVDVPAADRTAAITAAGRLLEQEGAIEPAYTRAMIEAVEEHGPYIVITPGFALAHARPDESVHRTALSLVRLAEPVVFGHESNDPVTLVAALAAADAGAHQEALAALAGVLADPERRRALDEAATAEELREMLVREPERPAATGGHGRRADRTAPAEQPPAADPAGAEEDTVPSKHLILTVCGNGVGTSLFLKNTTEQVLDRWGWTPYLSVEATDTISAKGKAKDADVLLTSGAIAQALGDVGVPVEVIENFTSTAEIDAALRRLYAI